VTGLFKLSIIVAVTFVNVHFCIKIERILLEVCREKVNRCEWYRAA